MESVLLIWEYFLKIKLVDLLSGARAIAEQDESTRKIGGIQKTGPRSIFPVEIGKWLRNDGP